MNFSPNGTVRERFGALAPGATPFPAWLVEGVRELDLGEELVYYAWELVRWVGGGTPREREALVTLVTASLVAAREGKSRVRLANLADRFVTLGGDPALAAIALEITQTQRIGGEILGSPDALTPLVLVDGDLVHRRVHELEKRVSSAIRQRLAAKSEVPYDKLLDALDDVLTRPPVIDGRQRRLSTEQQHAVRTAVTRRLSVITGGPGSGKTTVVASLLRVLTRLQLEPERIALAAPTGRAARRSGNAFKRILAAVTDPDASDRHLLERCPAPSTLHHLLSQHVHEAVVIVDEASMIDLELAAHLLSAVAEDARLVFLGDPEQLPPVGPGAVFRELLTASEGALALGEAYRLDPSAAGGRNLRIVARHVSTVNAERLFHPDSRAEESIAVRSRANDVQFRGVELLEVEHEEFLKRWHRERVATPEYRDLARRELELERDQPLGETARETLSRLAGILDEQQVLSVTRRDARRVNRLYEGAESVEPVIVLANDSSRGLVARESGLRTGSSIVFPRAEGLDVFFRESLAGNIALAYAITVHESQGSEYDHVALVLPPPAHPLLNRALLYTALTRARKSLTLLGERGAVIAAVARSL